MLPAIRNEEYRYPVPMFDLNVKDVEGFGDELKGFHEQFHDCFLRSESRSNFYNYRPVNSVTSKENPSSRLRWQ